MEKSWQSWIGAFRLQGNCGWVFQYVLCNTLQTQPVSSVCIYEHTLGIHILHPPLLIVRLKLMQQELNRFRKNLFPMTLTTGTIKWKDWNSAWGRYWACHTDRTRRTAFVSGKRTPQLAKNALKYLSTQLSLLTSKYDSTYFSYWRSLLGLLHGCLLFPPMEGGVWHPLFAFTSSQDSGEALVVE